MAMRPEIRQTIDMAKSGNQPGAMHAALEVLGAMLSGALDRLDTLEAGGVLSTKDILGSKVIEK